MLNSSDYISFGIILPIIIVFGLVGNIIALCVLNHRFLQKSPVFLLKLLAIHGILTMCYSIYHEVVPTMKAYFESDPKIFDSNYDYLDTYFIPGNVSNVSLFPIFNGIQPTNGGAQQNFLIAEFNDTFHEVGNKSYYDYYIIEELGIFSNTEKLASNLYVEVIKTYISYFLIHAGLLLTFLITTERCFVVYFPIKAIVWLTTVKIRIVTFISLLLCLSMHIPHLAKEILSQESHVNESSMRPFNAESIILPIRRGFIMLVLYTSSVICIFTFILNILLLIKLYFLKKAFEGCKHTKRPNGSENNVTAATIVLVFFQLPFHVFTIVIYELRLKYVREHLDQVIEILEIGRLLYMAHSALNFVIYCLMAKNCRHVFRLILKRFSKQKMSKTRMRKNFKSVENFDQGESENIPLHEINVKDDKTHLSNHSALAKTLTNTSIISAKIKRL